jgi:hypothetical protein
MDEGCEYIEKILLEIIDRFVLFKSNNIIK